MVFGILAVILFAVAFVFHGAGFWGSAWIDWQSFTLLGLVCLALHLLGVSVPRLPVTVSRRPGE